MQRENYRIISKGGVGEFTIMKDLELLTVFTYKGWFSHSGSARVGQASISIKSKNKWDTYFEIFRGREAIGEIVFHWRGNIAVAMEDRTGKLRQFAMLDLEKSRSWFLKDEKEKVVLAMKYRSHWARMNVEYDVEFKSKPSYIETMELLIACGYAMNLNRTKIAALKA